MCIRDSEQQVEYFDLLGLAARLCGLLGLVIGMIGAFSLIAEQGVATPAALADPLRRALATVALGLVVALVNGAAATLFRHRLHRQLTRLGLVVEELMMPFRGLKAMLPKASEAAAGAEGAHPVSETSAASVTSERDE